MTLRHTTILAAIIGATLSVTPALAQRAGVRGRGRAARR